LDVAAASQTNAAVDAVLEVVNFASETDYQDAERFVMAASFSSHPPEGLLVALLVNYLC